MLHRRARPHRAPRSALLELGVDEERIYLDHGLTGTNRDREGLDQGLAAVRAGDMRVVPKLATWLDLHGTPLAVIAAQLGHASTATTDVYLRKLSATELHPGMAGVDPYAD